MDWLADQLGYETQNDWYSLTVADAKQLGGIGLFNDLHFNSVHAALEAIYPECTWYPWLFTKAPPGECKFLLQL